MTAISRLARAKVNLTLHVTGRREDGYHLLDSLVVFPEIGDIIAVTAADDLTLSIDGPFAPGLDNGADNLVLRVARHLRPKKQGAAIKLTKNLPVASGIGGGSADAAATAHALTALWGLGDVADDLLQFGADVPVCFLGENARMRGIGEHVEPIGPLPEFHLVLVNPGMPIATPQVFSAMRKVDNPPMAPLPQSADLIEFTTWLGRQRNDLQDAACQIAPAVGEALAALSRTDGCLLFRMSGSGGTCFGIYETEDAARSAQATLAGSHPNWWVSRG